MARSPAPDARVELDVHGPAASGAAV